MRDPFRALRPLDPDKADALDHAFLTAEGDDRHELDIVAELIRRQTQRNRDPLLDPPAGAQADAEIRLGRIIHGDRELHWLGVTAGELTQHLGIFGRSGSGKSTLAMRILRRLCELNVPWVCLDYKRSARALKTLELARPVHVLALGRDIGASLHTNPLCPPPGVPLDTHLRQIVEILCHVWFAGEGVRALLIKAVEACSTRGVPTFADVREYVENLAVVQREVLWKQTATRILEAMTTGHMGRVLNTRTDAVALDRLLTEHTIVELDGLSLNDAVFLISVLIRHLTAALLAGRSRERLRLVVLVEEAHHLLGKSPSARESVLETALRESREIGCGFIVVDQTISSITPVALANLFATIVMNCKHRGDINAAAAALLLDEDQKDLLGTLPIGECVVRLADRWPRAVHIRVPPMPLEKGALSDRAIRRAFLTGPFSRLALDAAARTRSSSGDSAGPAHSTPNSPPQSDSCPIPAIPLPDKRGQQGHSSGDNARAFHRRTDKQVDDSDLDHESRNYLEHVAREPLLSVTERYSSLEVSRRKGDAIKRYLVDAGYLEPLEIPTPRGKVLLTGLTDDAVAWCSRHRVSIAPLNGGLRHAWWQARAASMLGERGWSVATEYTLLGHAFDIHATHEGQTLLLEVETGSSDWLGNLAMLESADADYKVVLWVGEGSILRARIHVRGNVTLLLPRQVDSWLNALSTDLRPRVP